MNQELRQRCQAFIDDENVNQFSVEDVAFFVSQERADAMNLCLMLAQMPAVTVPVLITQIAALIEKEREP